MCPLFSYAIIVSVEVVPYGSIAAGILLMPAVIWIKPVTEETFILEELLWTFY